MAPQSGTQDSAVSTAPESNLSEVERDLRLHPGRFDFFQAVRLLLRIVANREPVGRFARPAQEAVRFHVNSSLAFPPSQIQALDWKGESPHMQVNFMGLTGPMGVLPHRYSELIQDRSRERDRATEDFFDVFNHRAISLFYQAWEKYRFAVAYERDGKDRLSRYLMALIGLGTEGLQHRLPVRDDALLFFTGLLSLQARSATVLRQVLEDYFGVPVEVEQFVGSWQPLDASDQCRFADTDSVSEQLAVGAVAGDAIWDHQSRVRLKLGPLDKQQYLDFLPSGSAYEPLRALTTVFSNNELEIEVQLVLKREQVPRGDLDERGPEGPRLGWFTWMKSGQEFDRSPGDTILLLR